MTTIAPLRTAALAAIAAIGAIVFVDKAVFKPSVSQAIANGVRRDLDSYNSGVDHEEEVINTRYASSLGFLLLDGILYF